MQEGLPEVVLLRKPLRSLRQPLDILYPVNLKCGVWGRRACVAVRAAAETPLFQSASRFAIHHASPILQPGACQPKFNLTNEEDRESVCGGGEGEGKGICMPPRENGRISGFESRRGQSEVMNKMENSGKNVGMVAGSSEPATRVRNALEGEIRGIRVRIFPPMDPRGLATIQVGDGLDMVDCCRWAKSVLVWKTAELLRAYLNQEGVC